MWSCSRPAAAGLIVSEKREEERVSQAGKIRVGALGLTHDHVWKNLDALAA